MTQIYPYDLFDTLLEREREREREIIDFLVKKFFPYGVCTRYI